MTLEDAIIHAEETAKENICTPCGENHMQLAEWLKELKEYKLYFGNEMAKKKIDNCGYWDGLRSRKNHSASIEIMDNMIEIRKL